jgi:DNA-binding response OmpR family regulator
MFPSDDPFDILVVDDEPGLLNLARIYLEMQGGLRITTVPSAKAALEMLASRRFDAVVSDYQMPGMDGIELLKQFRARQINVPFILFTGRGREDVAIAALNNGADFYIQKGGEPVAQFAELRNALVHAIHRRGAEELVQSIVDNAPMMIMIVDEERRIQTFNRAVLDFTKMSPLEVAGLRCGLALDCANSREDVRGCGYSSHCDDCRLWNAIKRTISTGERCRRVEAVIASNSADDGKKVLMISTAPIRSFGKDLALVFLEDFTEFRLKQPVVRSTFDHN